MLSKEFARNHKNHWKSLESLQVSLSKLWLHTFATKLQLGDSKQKLRKSHFSNYCRAKVTISVWGERNEDKLLHNSQQASRLSRLLLDFTSDKSIVRVPQWFSNCRSTAIAKYIISWVSSNIIVLLYINQLGSVVGPGLQHGLLETVPCCGTG